MWLTSLLRGLELASRCNRGRHPSRHQRRCCVPRLEDLECRTLPSTLTVLDLADSGPGSLRQAVLDANANPGADVIDFAPELSGTIVLTGGQPSITDDLQIDGPGADRLAISGNDSSRVLQIAGGVTVGMDDLTITDGRADRGGAIRNAGGSLTLTRVVLFDNQAVGVPGAETWGGAIHNARGTLVLSQVALDHNQAFGTPGQIARGGAVFNEGGTVTVDRSTFTHNLVVGGRRLSVAAVGGPAGQGGAIANQIGRASCRERG